MINYQTQAQRDAANQKAADHMKTPIGGMEPRREGPSNETPEQVRARCGDKTQG